MKMNTNEWDLTKILENIEIPSKFPGVEYSLTPDYLRRLKISENQSENVLK